MYIWQIKISTLVSDGRTPLVPKVIVARSELIEDGVLNIRDMKTRLVWTVESKLLVMIFEENIEFAILKLFCVVRLPLLSIDGTTIEPTVLLLYQFINKKNFTPAILRIGRLIVSDVIVHVPDFARFGVGFPIESYNWMIVVPKGFADVTP
jgi:hypothetical protein